MIALDEFEVHPFRVALGTPFRGVTSRDGVLLRGPAGWGEWSPFPGYPAEVAARWLHAAVEAATRAPPAPRRDAVAVNVIVPATDPAHAHRIVTESGCATAKVKVAERGVAPERARREDLARVAAVRDALGADGRLRVDANAGWDLDEATRMLRALARYGLEYAEQPVAGLEEMARLRRRVDVPLAADESIRTAADPLRVAGLEAADIVVLKAQPLGGVTRALAVAEQAGLPVVVSSAVESSVGLAAGLAFAAALPQLPYACGLGTALLLAQDVVSDPLRPVRGELTVRPVEPDPALLRAARPGPGDERRLRARLQAAAAAPAGAGGVAHVPAPA